MASKLKAAVLGATGAVGQRFVALLSDHPQFEVGELVASERSAGKAYGDATHWVLDEAMPAGVRDVEVRLAGDDLDADVCFSAVPGGKAGPIERDLAARGCKVFSNARDLRMAEDVPLLIPEVNPEHAAMVKSQAGDGFIVTNPNCSTIVLTLTLKPVHDAFGLKRVHVTTMQAISGAGYPGVASLDILGNVVPHIGGEEDKIETEPRRLLGRLDGDRVGMADFRVSATATRVPVQEGHSMSVAVETETPATAAEVAEAMAAFRGPPQDLGLPTAPRRPVVVHDAPDRPQPRKDWRDQAAMAVAVGRVRADPVLGVKWFASGSNTVRGAAGCSVLNAELMRAQGYF